MMHENASLIRNMTMRSKQGKKGNVGPGPASSNTYTRNYKFEGHVFV